MPSKYPQSFRDRAMRMVVDRMEADEGLTQYQAIKEIAPKLNISTESLRRWIEQSQIDAGAKTGLSSEAQAEIRRLKRENAELRRANEILKSASAFFAAELDRPSTR
ncbi:transposase [Brachybacterium sacelli]|uniref:Transposase n=1 Tax=Brachybacterium sacelli TaxID=173364 RepID=A0ABS4X0U1_9MICO|nr:transposase [Brachybacterium sacelli]MBP2382087.1 transposase [Brachybacterium sacelli]MBP2383787.1 transposase [Brachybacterium sacelli]